MINPKYEKPTRAAVALVRAANEATQQAGFPPFAYLNLGRKWPYDQPDAKRSFAIGFHGGDTEDGFQEGPNGDIIVRKQVMHLEVARVVPSTDSGCSVDLLYGELLDCDVETKPPTVDDNCTLMAAKSSAPPLSWAEVEAAVSYERQAILNLVPGAGKLWCQEMTKCGLAPNCSTLECLDWSSFEEGFYAGTRFRFTVRL